MAGLPPRADLDQLRGQAKDLLREARSGGPAAATRMARFSERLSLDSAQVAVACDYGFASWARLKTEIDRRTVLDSADAVGLRALLGEHPELATEPMQHWCDHPGGPSPLSYVAMLRYDTGNSIWRDVAGSGAMARALLDAGAPADGDPGDDETPLMTAASYGDAEVAQVLIDAGANLDATASACAGGVPGGNALRHAAVFDMTDVVEVLVAAGATDVVQAAAAGDLTGLLRADTPEPDRVAALRMAARRGRLHVIDQLLASATPVDGVDRDGSTAVHEAAYNGRVDSVRHLLSCGADPNRHDTRFDSTPLGWCRHRREEVGPGHGHDEVDQLLAPITRPQR
ncbi:MAG: ankyrin repeat domain-containing protein [Actinomycetota bacterium]|nr:ankyrin repeat domain-containing protein [Actinomycetota bacterium]